MDTIRLNNRYTILGLDNKMLGRAHVKQDGSVICTFLTPDTAKKTSYSVRVYGPEEWQLQLSVKGWTLKDSYLVVNRVKLTDDKSKVEITFIHPTYAGYNMVLSVPFGPDWSKTVTPALIEQAKMHGTETHIGNFSALRV